MKCIIIDDEPLAIEIIESYIERIGHIEILAKINNPLEAITILNKEKVDLVFLDIQMPNLTGLELAKSIEFMPLFIFTTAYPQYAIEGFDLNALDYLVKPIPFPRFLKAVSRAQELLALKHKSEEAPVHHQDDFIFVKSEYENVKIMVDDILYIQGLKDYIKIYTSKTKYPILTLMNFNAIMEKLPSTQFMRIHRSYIIHINKISSLQKSKLLIDEDRIPIGEKYKSDVFKRLGL